MAAASPSPALPLSTRLAPAALAFLPAGLGGLSLSRLLYELFFPRLLWLGRPLPAFTLATLTAVLGWLLARWLQRRLERPGDTLLPFLPLLLNLAWLFDPAVNLIQSRFLFCASLWLMLVLVVYVLAKPAAWRWAGPVLLIGFLLPVYLLTLGQTVGRADTFEFQVVVPKLGIVHPTGYPLYLLLTKLFTFIPLHSMAWRVNLASAVYGLAALYLVYWIGQRLTKRPLPALLAAVALGPTPTFWSQAIEAEVYTLHSLVVAGALGLMLVVTSSPGTPGQAAGKRGARLLVGLAFLLGLGLTNHLTAVFLLPAFGLLLLFVFRGDNSEFRRERIGLLLILLLAFCLPLLLYVYLPIRWAAVNGEAMGLARFVDWVVGGRFQGALQWTAWLHEAARYQIVGRLLLAEWGWLNLLVIVTGFFCLARSQPRFALILFVTWLGYLFYALNYHVPDLAVFLLPAHLVMALCWTAGLVAVANWFARLFSPNEEVASSDATRPASEDAGLLKRGGIALLLLASVLIRAGGETWPAVDRSQDDGRTQWGQAVLSLPLDEGAAILADSEKIAPLYYLQQAEGMRPDLDILVLPDEATYRAELDSRIAAGQTVYLARFLPGLEGVYHLRSVGPLTEVSREPLADLPADSTPTSLNFDPIHLLAYQVEPVAPVFATGVGEGQSALTFYWQAEEPVGEIWLVYVRWAGSPGLAGVSQHPANNYYPTVAWEVGEIVPDYHLLPRPVLSQPTSLELQVALAPPFSRPEALAWQTVTTMTLPATNPDSVEAARPLRAQIGPVLFDGAAFPTQIRPGTRLPVVLTGYGEVTADLILTLQPNNQIPRMAKRLPIPNYQAASTRLAYLLEANADVPNGRYQLVANSPSANALCGWLARPADGCILGEVEVSGVPLPAGATNFADKIALVAVEMPETELRPGDQLEVNLTWQALAPMSENYTVFVQVLDGIDRIVGQVDSWPVQGTYPTSQWQVGEIVNDTYQVQLAADLPPGQYRLQVGWYLLATLQRLPVVDETGAAVDDKLLVPGLVVPE